MKMKGESKPQATKPPPADRGAGMSDNERMGEFAQTGDVAYIRTKPDLMQRMGIAFDDHREIAPPSSREMFGVNDDILSNVNADSKSLEKLSTTEAVAKLLDLAIMRRKDNSDHDVEDIKSAALEHLYSILSLDPSGISAIIFNEVNPTKVKTLSLIPTLGALYEKMQDEVFKMRKGGAPAPVYLGRFRELMIPFADKAKKALDANENREGIYLVQQSLLPLLLHISHLDETVRKSNSGGVFEITNGHFATFTEDEERVYIAPTDLYEAIARNPYSQESYEMIMDQGTSIDAEMASEMTGGTDSTAFDEFVLMNRGETREKIEDDFGVDLQHLTLREQFHFLNFLKSVRVWEAEHVMQFTDTYGTLGLKTFLALEELGPDFGWGMVGSGVVAGKAGLKDVVSSIFEHFVRLQAHIDTLDEYILEHFKIPVQKETLQKAAANIRKRAARFLHDVLQRPIDDSTETRSGITDAITRAEEGAVLFASVFRSLSENAKEIGGNLNMEALAGYETYSTEELAKNAPLIEGMKKILRENYDKHYANEALKQEVMHYFEQALKNSDTTFHILKDGDRVVGFVRFDKRFKEGKLEDVYFGSFNVDGPFGGGTIGETLFATVLGQYKKFGVPIRADCDPDSPATKKIYFPIGFVQEGEVSALAGVPSISIVLKP